jgi:nicotinamide mononucleotide transporter
MTAIYDWLSVNYIEALGTIISIVYLYFSIKQNIWLWPLGLVSSAFYVYIFFVAKIYADMGLQVYYVLISIYGWYTWSVANKKTENDSRIKTVKSNDSLLISLAFASIILFIILSQILIHFTDSNIPYIDAFTTSLSIVATWMLAKRYIEHWMVWIVVDAVSSFVYVYKELYFTVFLYLIYTIMAVVGLQAWLKDMKLKTQDA